MMTADTPREIATGASPPGAAVFRDAKTLTRSLKVLLWIMIALDVVAAVSTFLEIGLFVALQEHLYASAAAAQADAAESDARQRAIGMLQIIMFVITGIVFLCWIYRANHNARQLGAAGMRFSPGWSIGWYFIPIANFWKPYQAMKEIWRASADPAHWQDYPRGSILPWWWFCFLLANVTGTISFRLARAAKDIPMLITTDVAIIIANVAAIVLSLVAIALVGQIYRMQMSHVRA